MIDEAMGESFPFYNQLLVVRSVREGIRTGPFRKELNKVLFINAVRMVIRDTLVYYLLL